MVSQQLTLYSNYPSLIKKIHKLKINEKESVLELWGDGLAKREVIFVDDIADACVYFMNKKYIYEIRFHN